jgi:hypothetical protein
MATKIFLNFLKPVWFRLVRVGNASGGMVMGIIKIFWQDRISRSRASIALLLTLVGVALLSIDKADRGFEFDFLFFSVLAGFPIATLFGRFATLATGEGQFDKSIQVGRLKSMFALLEVIALILYAILLPFLFSGFPEGAPWILGAMLFVVCIAIPVAVFWALTTAIGSREGLPLSFKLATALLPFCGYAVFRVLRSLSSETLIFSIGLMVFFGIILVAAISRQLREYSN